MKDKLNTEIQEGDLVAQVNYQAAFVGVVHGGITKGGKVRFLSQGGKSNSHSYNLIIISREQFINSIDKTTQKNKIWLEYHPDSMWMQKMIEGMEQRKINILEIFDKR